MGVRTLLSSFFSKRSEPEQRSSYADVIAGNGLFDRLYKLFDNSSNTNLIGDSSMRVATVFKCVRMISHTVGMLPANVHRFNAARNTTVIAYDHWSYVALHTRANSWLTSTQFWILVVQYMLLHGEAFAVIDREKYQFKLYRPEDVQVNEGPDGEPYYWVKGKPYSASDILHYKMYSKDGKRGYSVITEHRETIGSAKKLKEFSNRSLNVVPPVYLKTPNNVNILPDGLKSLKEKLKGQASEYFDEGSLPILTNGMTIENVGVKPVDAAYLDQINATKDDIHDIFGIPNQKNLTTKNLEQLNLEFLTYTLSPILKNIEEETTYKVYTTREQATLFMKFNIGALLRTDLKTQAEWFEKMFKISVYSPNDILSLLDMNTYEGGDRRFVEGNNMVPVDKIDELIKAKTTTTPTTTQKLTEETKKRLKEKFNGKTDEIIHFFENEN